MILLTGIKKKDMRKKFPIYENNLKLKILNLIKKKKKIKNKTKPTPTPKPKISYQNTRGNSKTLEVFPLKLEKKTLVSNFIQK